MMKNVRETLAGRIGILELYSLSAREKAGLVFDTDLDFSLAALQARQRKLPKNDVIQVFHHIWEGGMPQVQGVDDELRQESVSYTHLDVYKRQLAKRDAEWMGKIYTFLGLSVGCVIHGISDKTRKAAYRADITYGTNNEFGFDYLRDNMVIYQDQLTQRDLNYAIIDEVDSILIDEARTPLIISGQGDESTDLYRIANKFVNTLYEGENAAYTICLLYTSRCV